MNLSKKSKILLVALPVIIVAFFLIIMLQYAKSNSFSNEAVSTESKTATMLPEEIPYETVKITSLYRTACHRRISERMCQVG